jgi:hypothetical protein
MRLIVNSLPVQLTKGEIAELVLPPALGGANAYRPTWRAFLREHPAGPNDIDPGASYTLQLDDFIVSWAMSPKADTVTLKILAHEDVELAFVDIYDLAAR